MKFTQRIALVAMSGAMLTGCASSNSYDASKIYSNLTPELHAKIQEAFFSFEWDGTELQKEFEKSNEGQFLPMNYKEFWDVIRKIDAANGVSYSCG